MSAARAKPNTSTLVQVVCYHRDTPRVLGRVLAGAMLWVPDCTDDRGRMRPHYADADAK